MYQKCYMGLLYPEAHDNGFQKKNKDKEYGRPERRTPFPPARDSVNQLPSRILTDIEDSREPVTPSLTLPASSKALCSRKTKYEKKRLCNPQHCELYAT